MEGNDLIKYYCFNKKCRSSIFSKHCVISMVAIGRTLESQYCAECHKEMVSKEELNIKIQLGQIFHEDKSLTSFIIDDDPVYHVVVKKLFEHSTTFDEPEHYMDGPGALRYLNENLNEDTGIPDVIFVDVNMPNMDAWEFLKAFAAIYPKLKKKIDIYVMSSVLVPVYNDYVKSYPFVKGIISKDFNLGFLNGLAV